VFRGDHAADATDRRDLQGKSAMRPTLAIVRSGANR
jgi:hypothetical protein